MEIEGPFRISVLENPEKPGYELHLDFTEAFQALPVEAQAEQMRDYIAALRTGILALGEDSRDGQGMATIRQIAEKLYPYIEAGDLALEETIVVEIAPDSPLASLAPGSHANH
jgi:plasmid stabilization system protein ParE